MPIYVYMCSPSSGKIEEVQHLDHEILKDMQTNAPQRERDYWVKQKCKQDNEGFWKWPEGKIILPKNFIYRYAAVLSHELDHDSTGGMVSIINGVFTA